MRDLPERQRRVITLRYLLDLSQADVAAALGVPGRGQRKPRWAPHGPDSLVGAEFECVVLDIDEDRRPVITDALTGDDAEEYRRRHERVRELREGQRFVGRVAVVLSFGAFVDFEDLRGLVGLSELDAANPLAEGQEVEVEVIGVDARLARISLRVVDP